jgi:hypothetical protein
MTKTDRPFNTIESTHEYLAILSDQIDEAINDVRKEIAASHGRKQERRTEAWELVLYTLTRLSFHTANGRRLVNDLRTLRNLLSRGGAPESEAASETASERSGGAGEDGDTPVDARHAV